MGYLNLPFVGVLEFPLSFLAGHLKGGHLKMDFALMFALDTSILTALSKKIPQGTHRLDRQGAV